MEPGTQQRSVEVVGEVGRPVEPVGKRQFGNPHGHGGRGYGAQVLFAQRMKGQPRIFGLRGGDG